MRPEVIRHIETLEHPAALDVRGEWVFIPNAKTGTCSMCRETFPTREVLKRRGDKNYWAIWNEIIKPRIDDVFIYTFVRNPWDRILSAFSHCQQKSKSFPIPKHWEFTDWVKDVLAVKGPGINMHFAEQTPSFLLNGEFMPEVFVGRFESIEADWRVVADRLNVDGSLPHVNKSEHRHYTECYDEDSRDAVSRLYATELAALDYEFGKFP